MNLAAWSSKVLQNRRAWLAGAGVICASVVLWGTAQTQEPDGAGAGPLTTAATRTPKSSETPVVIDFPRRSAKLGVSPGLFTGHSWYVPPPPPPPVKAGPPPKPTAPPLPFTLLGSYEPAGGRAVFYLVRGDQVFDVKVGDTLDGVYSVDAIQNEELLFTYLPLKQQQTLSLRR